MTVELLWWDGCPSHPRRSPSLEGLLREEGMDAEVQRIEVETTSRLAASASPALRRSAIDGRDIVPPGEGEPYSLTCRVYPLRDGSVSPVPIPRTCATR